MLRKYFPVAMKPSNVKSQLVSILLESEKPPETAFVKLQKRKVAKGWNVKDFSRKFEGFQQTWELILHASILANFLITNYTVMVARNRVLEQAQIYNDAIFAIAVFLDMIERKFGMFFLDLFLVLPFSTFYNLIHQDYDEVCLWLKILGNCRIYKVFWKIHRVRNEALGDNRKVITSIIFGVLLVIVLQTFACAWFLIMCPFGRKNCVDFISQRFYLEKNVREQHWCSYVTIFYHVWMIGFGYGYLFENLQMNESFIVGLTSWYGLLLLTFLGGNLVVIEYFDRKRNHKLKMQLEKTLELCRTIGIDTEYTRLLQNHHQALLRFKLGAKNKTQLLPESLTKEISFDQNFPALGRSLLFKNFPVAYLGQVSAVMRHEFFTEKSWIYKRKDLKDKMIVVVNGVIEVMSSDDESRGILALGPGSCLGEASLVLKIFSKTSIMAKTYVEVQVLYKKDYNLQILPKFKNEHRSILRTINERLKSKTEPKQSFFRRFKNPAGKTEETWDLYRSPTQKFGNSYFLAETSTFKTNWDFLITMTSLYIALSYPYYAILADFPVFPTQISDLLLVFDVIINVLTIRSKKTSTTSSARKLIFKNLHENQTFLDIFAAFYFEYLTHSFPNGERFYKVAKLNRLVKFYKFVIVKRWILARFLVIAAIFTYWLGLTTYMFTCFNDFCRETGWFKTKMHSEILNYTETPIFAQRLFFSQFFALSYMKNFKLHEIALMDPRDMIMTALIIIFGSLLFLILTIKLTTGNLLKVKDLRKIEGKILGLRRFCARFALNEKVEERLINYVEVNKGFRVDLLENVPEEVEEALLLEENLEVIRGVELFASFHEGFLKDLAKRAKMYLLPPMDILAYYGSVNKEMFIVKEGVCAYKFGGGSYKELKPLATIGLCSLLFNIPETIMVRTLTHCKVLSIDGFELQVVLNLHPEVNGFIKKLYKDVMYRTLNKDFNGMPSIHHFSNSGKNTRSNRCMEFIKGASFVNVLKYCKNQNDIQSNEYNEVFKEKIWTRPLRFLLLPMTIVPSGFFFLSWQILKATIGYSYGIITPLNLVMSPNALRIPNLFLDIFMYLDLYVGFHVGFFGKLGQLVVHPLKTAGNYVHGGFLLDFLLVLPYEEICYVFLAENLDYYHYFRMIKLAEVSKFVLVIRALEKQPEKNGALLQVFKFFSFAILLHNFLACLLVYTSCSTTLDDFNCMNQSWIVRSKYGAYKDLTGVYLIAAYWTNNLMFGLNFGDLEVQGGTNLILSICIMVTGTLFLSYTFASLLPHLINFDFKMIKYKKKLKILKVFLKKEKVDQDLVEKIEEQLISKWRRTENININKLLSSLHTNLLQDALTLLYEDTLKRVPLFKEMNRSFLRIFSMIVQPETFLEDQIIVKKNDILDYFYIIHKGKVHVELLQADLEVDLEKGSIFGYFYNESLPVMTISVKSLTIVEVLRVKTIDYYNILRNYPKFHMKIQNIISEYKDFMSSSKNFQENIMISKIFERKEEGFIVKGKRRRSKISTKIFYYTDFFFAVIFWLSSLVTVLQFVLQVDTFLFFNILLDVLYILRLILAGCFKPFQDRIGEIMVDNHFIRRQYLKRPAKVVPDFILLIMTLVAYVLYHLVLDLTNRLYIYTILYLVNIYRLVYTVKFYKDAGREIMNNHCVLKLLRLFKWLIFTIHNFACTWAFMASQKSKENPFALYKESLSFVSNIFTSLGTTGPSLKTPKEFLFVITLQLISKILWIVLIASTANIIFIQVRIALKYEHYYKEMRDYLKSSNVHPYVIKKCLDYMKMLWNVRSGENLPGLISKLPQPLKQELKSAIYKPLLSKCYIFTDTEALFLEKLSSLLDFQIYFPGNIIVHLGQVDNCMYFIKKGEVEILSLNPDLTETIHDVLHETEMFGVGQGLFRNMPHQFTFRARTEAHILSLQQEKWEHLLQFYKKSEEVIYERLKNMHLQLSESLKNY